MGVGIHFVDYFNKTNGSTFYNTVRRKIMSPFDIINIEVLLSPPFTIFIRFQVYIGLIKKAAYTPFQ